MLLPRFSLKFVFLLVTLGAVVSFLAAQGRRGVMWGLAMAFACAAAAVFSLFHVFFFFVIWLVRSRLSGLDPVEHPASPAEARGAKAT